MISVKRGFFVVLYSSNNLGKSSQMDLLEKKWQELGLPCKKIKYPIYDLEPTGPLINSVLRKGMEMSEAELQKNFAQNRVDFQPQLERWLEEGHWVFGEDYKGTGLAWGLTRGVSRELLDEYNKDLLEPDLAILLDGERFTSGIERRHRNETVEIERRGRSETAKQGLWERNREIYRGLGKEMGWVRVEANGSREEVHERIMEIISDEFGLL